MAYSMAGGLCYGALMGYINTSQQLFQDMYFLGEQYAIWFGISAAFISAATFTNAKLVTKYRMEFICLIAIGLLIIWSLGFAYLFAQNTQHPDIIWWMSFNCISLFLLGLTFGNFNAIALRDCGHIAGFAAAVVAAITSALSLGIAWLIGTAFDHTVTPMMNGYIWCGIATLLVILGLDRSKPWRR